MATSHPQRGAIAAALALLLLLFVAATVASALAAREGLPKRDDITANALARAKEALLAYASARPVDEIVGPGYLPCPDLDDDGWAESICGSLNGETGQAQRLGRLPWKTLGLPDLRDAHGERLWYAVSSKHKGLLNCAASSGCVDMGPEAAIGTITVRDAAGNVLHDGTSSSPYAPGIGGAVAVVLSPGAPLRRWGGNDQRRTCESGTCNTLGQCMTQPASLTPKCHPENYLDRSPGPAFFDEDNARFIDRNDAAGRDLNRDGFIQGPVVDHQGVTWVNDRVLAISYDDLMPRVMRRVAAEVTACLQGYGALPPNTGRTPWATPACRARSSEAGKRWSDAEGVLFGRIPDTPFRATEQSSGGRMSTLWPVAPSACRIADTSGSTSSLTRYTWWSAWKRHVFYAVAEPNAPKPTSPEACDSISCLTLVPTSGETAPTPGYRFAVLVAGHPLLFDSHRQARDSAADREIREWLEASNAELRFMNANPAASDCPADGIGPAGPVGSRANQLTIERSRLVNDVVIATP
jgi:hypothetical protein